MADSTHRVAARWKWGVVFAAPLLAVLMAWAIVVIIGNLRPDSGWDNVVLTALIVAALAGLILLAIAAPAWTFRAQITLTGDTMTLRGIFRTRVLAARDIEGYRWIKGQLNLYLQGDQWPVNLSYFDDQAVLYEWVFRHAVDLNAAALAEEEKQISKDVTLGMTEAQKEEKLARLRALTRKMNWIAYVAAAVGVLNAWFVEEPTVQEAAAAVLIVMPILMLLLALKNPGHVRIDYPEGSRYPEILTGILACSLALGLMSLFDRHTLLGDRFYQWVVPLTVATAVLWALIEVNRLREHYARSRVIAAITVASLLFLSSFWIAGAIYQINKNFDASETAWSTTDVIDKRIEKTKSTITYYVEVAPWDDWGDELLELDVSEEEYYAVDIGAPAEIGVRRGALDIPWVAEIRPSTRKDTGVDFRSRPQLSLPPPLRPAAKGTVSPDADRQFRESSWWSGGEGWGEVILSSKV